MALVSVVSGCSTGNTDDETPPADAAYVESIHDDTRRLVALDTRYGGDDLVDQRADAAPRSRFNDLAHLLAAQVAVRTWHDAEASLGELAADARAVRSSRTTALIRRILHQINDEDSGSPPSILDTGEHLAVLLDGAD